MGTYIQQKHRMKGQHYYYRIYLYPEHYTMEPMRKYQHPESYDVVNMNSTLCQMDYYDWDIVLLRGYFKHANRTLLSKIPVPTQDYHDRSMTTLRKDTLYLVELKGTESHTSINRHYTSDSTAYAQIYERYPYPAKFVSVPQLGSLLADTSLTVNYLLFTKSNSDKLIAIYSSKKGIIFSSRGGWVSKMSNRAWLLIKRAVAPDH